MSRNLKHKGIFHSLFCSSLTHFKKGISIIDKAELISNSLNFPNSVPLLVKWDNTSSLQEGEKGIILVYSLSKYLMNYTLIFIVESHNRYMLYLGSNSNVYSCFIISLKLEKLRYIYIYIYIGIKLEKVRYIYIDIYIYVYTKEI